MVALCVLCLQNRRLTGSRGTSPPVVLPETGRTPWSGHPGASSVVGTPSRSSRFQASLVPRQVPWSKQVSELWHPKPDGPRKGATALGESHGGLWVLSALVVKVLWSVPEGLTQNQRQPRGDPGSEDTVEVSRCQGTVSVHRAPLSMLMWHCLAPLTCPLPEAGGGVTVDEEDPEMRKGHRTQSGSWLTRVLLLH